MTQAQEKINDTDETFDIGSRELIVLENLNPVDLFKPKGLDSVLKEVAEKARSIIIGGIETQKDRDSIRSIAAKVGGTKTAVHKLGTKYTESMRLAVKESNAERDRGIAFLQDLQNDIRKPLTEYEEAEKQRITDADMSIERLSDCAVFDFDKEILSDDVKSRIDRLVLLYQNRDFSYFSELDQEKYNTRAEYTYDRTRVRLDTIFQERLRYETDQKELEELREKQITQAKKDEEDRIRQEAADKARHEAEESARIERESSEKAAADRLAAEKEKSERIEREKKEADENLKKAEQDRIAAEKKAESDKAAAVQAEKDRADAEKQREKEAAEKREANKKHRAKINNEILYCLKDLGLDEPMANLVIKTIADKHIPYVTINY